MMNAKKNFLSQTVPKKTVFIGRSFHQNYFGRKIS